MKHIIATILLATCIARAVDLKTAGSLTDSTVSKTNDGLVIVDNSADTLKKISIDEMWQALGGTNVSTTELGYLDGLTGAIQTQIDLRAPLASPTFTGTVTVPDASFAYSKLSIADADLTIAKTSGLQTALDAKLEDNADVAAAIAQDPAIIQAVLDNTAFSGTFAITAPVQYSGHSDALPVQLSGTYSIVSGSVVKAQWKFGGDDTWRAVGNFSASGGTWSGTAKLPAGNGTLTVRVNESLATDTVDDIAVGAVIAVFGQSNARGAINSGSGPEYSGTRGFLMYADPTNTAWAWQATTNPTSYHASALESIWPSMVNYLEDELKKPVVLVIGGAEGGSGFNDDRWNEGDDLYEDTVAALNGSGVRKIDYAIFEQGEDDAEESPGVSSYKSDVQAMWDAMRTDVAAAANAKLLIPLISCSAASSTETGQHEVREAVIQLADDASSGILVGAPRFAGMSAGNASTNPVHPTYATDVDWLAKKWTRIFYGLFKGGEEIRGPRLHQTRLAADGGLADDKIELVFKGNTNITLPETTGWEFTDTNTGTLTISSVTTIDRGLQFTLTPDPEGDVTMSFGKLYSALESQTGDSGYLVPFPPEPFYDYDLGTTYPTNLSNGLLAYWALDEASGTRADDVGSNDMTETGTVDVGTGLLAANAAEIDADTDYLTSGSGVGALTSGFAVSLWVKAIGTWDDDGDVGVVLATNCGDSGGTGQFRIYLDNRGRIYAQMYGNGNDAWGWRNDHNVIDVSDGSWHHVYFSWDGTPWTGRDPQDATPHTFLTGHLVLEIDGVSQSIESHAGTHPWSSVDSGNSAVKVGYLSGQAGNQSAYVEQVGIWNRPLNTAEKDLLNTSPGTAYGDF